MIELENLNDVDFEELVDLAKKQIAQLSEDWNNTQEYDPGITLIELFSWLKVAQHKYMSETADNVNHRFLNMMGINIEKNKGSKTKIEISNAKENLNIPKGTKWAAGNLIFENATNQMVVDSKITGVHFINPENDLEINSTELDGKRIFNVFGQLNNGVKKEERMLVINFDKPIDNNLPFNLYFDIYGPEGKKRNPVGSNDNFIEMAEIDWEFYGEKDGKISWHKLDTLYDNTHRFLFSDIIKLSIPGNMQPADNNAYKIRARLNKESYDFAPQITGIKLNVFEVDQMNTLCETTMVKKCEIPEDGIIKISNNLALYGKYHIYTKKEDGFKPLDSCKIKKDIKNGIVEFVIKNIENAVKDFNYEDEVVMIVSYDTNIERIMNFGSGTGISNQVINFNFSDVLYDNFGLAVGKKVNNEVLFDKWNKVDDFFSSSKYDKDYILDCIGKFIMFGDHERGEAPSKLEKNIRLLNLSFTKGKESNIKKGMINRIKTENPYFKDLIVEQISDATGGKDLETLDIAKNRAAEILDCGKKAVTVADYERIVKQTPGLIIDNIKVLPAYVPKGEKEAARCVTIVIESGNRSHTKPLESYVDNICNYIDKYRLLNTKVYVTSPTYIGLSISGNVVVNSYYRNSLDEIKESINDFIDKTNKSWGQTLCLGDLFGMIDRLDCVSYVEDLSVLPSGDYIEKTMSEDIIIPPNGAYYIENIDLNYTKSANV